MAATSLIRGDATPLSDPATAPAPRKKAASETAFGNPRNFLNNDFVYVIVSSRARGLSVGVNLNPDKSCNFDCFYCEVDRTSASKHQRLNVDQMAMELTRTLSFIHAGQLREHPDYCQLPAELLKLRHVALSGDGEPTLSPDFAEALQAVVHIRALGQFPFFKLVLLTNATGLDIPEVQFGLKFLTRHDELWVKLDAGTQAYMDRINLSEVPLEKVLANIRQIGSQRPVVIQGLFTKVLGEEPLEAEISAYAERLNELKEAGTKISLVQIYSATRPTVHSGCTHLPLRALSAIAQRVRQQTGLKVEVF